MVYLIRSTNTLAHALANPSKVTYLSPEMLNISLLAFSLPRTLINAVARSYKFRFWSIRFGFFTILWRSKHMKHITDLNMTKLCDLDPGVGNGNGTACFQTVEEPLFDGVVVQRSVDVNGPYRSPVHVSCLQQALCLELPLVSALRVNCIRLHNT